VDRTLAGETSTPDRFFNNLLVAWPKKTMVLDPNPLRDQRLQAPEVAVTDAQRLETDDGLPQILRT
jgi:hypothetical protein